MIADENGVMIDERVKCTQCKFHYVDTLLLKHIEQNNSAGRDIQTPHKCNHPKLETTKLKIGSFIWEIRRNPNKCGPYFKWFEAKK